MTKKYVIKSMHDNSYLSFDSDMYRLNTVTDFDDADILDSKEDCEEYLKKYEEYLYSSDKWFTFVEIIKVY